MTQTADQSKSWNRLWRVCLVIFLLGLHVALAMSSMARKSATYDEIYHITAGYRYWRFNDYRLNPEAGNWVQRWVALPLTFMALDYPDTSPTDVIDAAHDFFFESGNPALEMIDRARLMTVFLSLALALVVFGLARRYFSPPAGWIAMGLYVVSPTILAHARLATSDLALAGCLLVAADTGWRLIERVCAGRVVCFAVAATAAVLVKLTGVVLLPLMVIMGMFRIFDSRPMPLAVAGFEKTVSGAKAKAAVAAASLLVAAVIGMGLIWVSYGCRYSAAPTADGAPLLTRPASTPAVAVPARYRLLPEAFLAGIDRIAADAHGRPAFLNGRYSGTGWWYFFPMAMAMKTPLSIGVLAVLGGLWALLWKPGWWRWGRCLPLWVLPALVLAAAMASHMNIGLRYVLAVYPPLFIGIGGALAHWLCRLGRRRGAIGLALAAVVVTAESQSVWPDYLAFFNAAAGGPSAGYRRLVDSSLDWGQDLPALRRYIDRVDRATPVFIAYFGSADPAAYGVRGIHFNSRGYHWLRDKPFVGPARSFLPGVYCISATDLAQVYGVFGGWTPSDERAYQQAKARVARWTDRVRREPAGADTPLPPDVAQSFIRLRHARLCAYLRTRTPDAQLGHSILVFSLTSADLVRALDLPLKEAPLTS